MLIRKSVSVRSVSCRVRAAPATVGAVQTTLARASTARCLRSGRRILRGRCSRPGWRRGRSCQRHQPLGADQLIRAIVAPPCGGALTSVCAGQGRRRPASLRVRSARDQRRGRSASSVAERAAGRAGRSTSPKFAPARVSTSQVAKRQHVGAGQLGAAIKWRAADRRLAGSVGASAPRGPSSRRSGRRREGLQRSAIVMGQAKCDEYEGRFRQIRAGTQVRFLQVRSGQSKSRRKGRLALRPQTAGLSILFTDHHLEHECPAQVRVSQVCAVTPAGKHYGAATSSQRHGGQQHVRHQQPLPVLRPPLVQAQVRAPQYAAPAPQPGFAPPAPTSEARQQLERSAVRPPVSRRSCVTANHCRSGRCRSCLHRSSRHRNNGSGPISKAPVVMLLTALRASEDQ